MRFGVESFAPTLAKATATNEGASGKLVAVHAGVRMCIAKLMHGKAIKNLGLKDCHLQMAALSVEILYESNYNEPVSAIKGSHHL